MYSAREQDPLFLADGQRASYVAYQAVVGHGHGHDLVVNPGHLRAQHHSLLVEGRIEEADVAGERLLWRISASKNPFTTAVIAPSMVTAPLLGAEMFDVERQYGKPSGIP